VFCINFGSSLCGAVTAERNPMTLVTVRGATKRMNAPRSLTFEEFQKFVSELPEPFRTMALLCLCLGLRISECLALKWADVDWLSSKISVERAIVRQRVDDVKTAGSRKQLSIDGSLLEVLKTWKQTTQFSANRRLGFCFPYTARPSSEVLSSSLGSIPGSSRKSESRQASYSHDAPQLSILA
jgi:integrase